MANYIITLEKNHKTASSYFPDYKIITPKEASTIKLEDGDKAFIDADNADSLLNIVANGGKLVYNTINWNKDIISCVAKFQSGTEYIAPPTPMGEDSLPEFSPALLDSDEGVYELSIEEQKPILDKIFGSKGIITADSIYNLAATLQAHCIKNKLFMRDIITGNVASALYPKKLINMETARNTFSLIFMDKVKIKDIKVSASGDTNIIYKSITPAQLREIWTKVIERSCYNSRKEFYDAIPEWDGEERIKTFMKTYFLCDTNPNFFLLFMTSIIGKIVNPAKNYVPYFFDFVCKYKGIGKTHLLLNKLLGGKYAVIQRYYGKAGRGWSDFFVDIYDGNNVIVIDDECTWEKAGMSNDELKSITTAAVDKFSRKNQQPEEHNRAFIITRTSNDVKTVYNVDERRQVIFQCGINKNNDCRILNLPDSFFKQMLAEAKVYHAKNGIYELNPNDWHDVKETNIQNYNYETPIIHAIEKYIDEIRRGNSSYSLEPISERHKGKIFGWWGGYDDWKTDKKQITIFNRHFWDAIDALSSLPEYGIHPHPAIHNGKGSQKKVFLLDKNPMSEEEKLIADIPDIF